MLFLLPAALAATLIAVPTRCANVICGSQVYSHPDPADALRVAGAVPFSRADPEHQADAALIFAEPAFFSPKFSALLNSWQTNMVQLPLVWRYKSARLALLFSANDAGQVLLPSINLNWRIIQSAAAGVLESCIQEQNGVGGVWIVSDQSKTPYLAVYIYEAGSAFEVVMNGYMITGKGISPYNPRRLGVEGVALNATLLVATSAGEIAATGTGTGVESVRMSRLPPPMSAGLAGVDVQ